MLYGFIRKVHINYRRAFFYLIKNESLTRNISNHRRSLLSNNFQILRHNQKITSQYDNLFSIMQFLHVHLIDWLLGEHTSSTDAKETSHFGLVILYT
jgi:hypothetical protein